MNSLNKFVLIVSVLVAVEAARKRLLLKPDVCPIKFPDGFFCTSICQESDKLEGNTVMCFLSNDGEYHRLVGRNPTSGAWRFYKVDETSDVSTLCKISETGDKFFSDKSDVMCSKDDSSKRTEPPQGDKTTEHTNTTVEQPPTTKSTPADSKRFSLKDLIQKINEEVAKLFHGKKETTETTETEAPEARSAHRYSFVRSASANDTKPTGVPPMDEICQLATTEVCGQNKIISCEIDEQCCWAKIDSEKCKPEILKQQNECYKGLSVIIGAIKH